MIDDDLMAPVPPPETDGTPYWMFTLIMAEVIFNCDLGIQTRRIQFISKSDADIFPRARLVQLQKMAASNVVEEVKRDSNGAIVVKQVEAVYLLGAISLGWMTEEQFHQEQGAEISIGEIGKEDNAPVQKDSNVVPLIHVPV